MKEFLYQATCLATYMAINKKKSVALFNLEMGGVQIVNRMLSSVGQIDSQKLRTGRMDHTDWKKYNETLTLLADTKFYIDDTPGITVSEIRSKCRKLATSPSGLDIVVIDYLTLIQGSSKNGANRQQEVADISRALKTMAMELNVGQRTNEVSEISRDLKKLAMELEVPVIALAQLSRGVESRPDKRPMMSDLRDSGAIEQDADIVMFIYRDEYYNRDNVDNKGKAEVIIAKHRNGGVGTINLLFQSNITKFKNPTSNN